MLIEIFCYLALTCLVWPWNVGEGEDYKLLPGESDNEEEGTQKTLEEEVSDL